MEPAIFALELKSHNSRLLVSMLTLVLKKDKTKASKLNKNNNKKSLYKNNNKITKRKPQLELELHQAEKAVLLSDRC